MSEEGAIQRELGELKQRLAGLEKSHGRQLGELRDQFALFLKEERDEHRLINTGIAELKSMVELHLATERGGRRILMAVSGTLGAGAMALAVKLWDLVKSS